MTEVVGTFTPEDVESFMSKAWGKVVRVRGMAHVDGKVLNMSINGVQVQGYPVRSGMVKLVVTR